MIKNNWLFSPNGQGVTISICLHLFALGLAYCIQHISTPEASSGQAYRITLQSTSTSPEVQHHLSKNRPKDNIQAVRPPISQLKKPSKNQLNNKNLCLQQEHHKQPDTTQPHKTTQSSKTSKIDKRGLYTKNTKRIKQAGATLELKGWEWDTVPIPKDNTEELGKIVFEIKVDPDGEIISIQTIEKTVTPMVEKIYADALRTLTFNKTTETLSNISTGKVTFVLVVK